MEPEEWVDDAAPVAAAAAVQPKPSPAPAAAVAAAAAPAAPAQQVRRPEKNEQKKIIFDWAHLLPPRAFATPNEPSSLVFSPLFLNFSSHKTTSEATMTTSSSRRRWLKGHKACSGAVLSADSIGSFFLSLALLSADRRSSNLALSDLFLSCQSLRLSPTSCPSRRRWEEEEQQLGRPVLLPTEGRTRRRRHSSRRPQSAPLLGDADRGRGRVDAPVLPAPRGPPSGARQEGSGGRVCRGAALCRRWWGRQRWEWRGVDIDLGVCSRLCGPGHADCERRLGGARGGPVAPPQGPGGGRDRPGPR